MPAGAACLALSTILSMLKGAMNLSTEGSDPKVDSFKSDGQLSSRQSCYSDLFGWAKKILDLTLTAPESSCDR